MADSYLKLNYPPEFLTRIVIAFCGTFDFNPNDNKTPGEFTTEKIIDYISSIILEYETEKARKEAVSFQYNITQQDIQEVRNKVTVEYNV